MVEALYSILPSFPGVSAEAQSWAIAAVVFAMVFCPLWRFARSICNGIDRVNARKEAADKAGRAIGFHNRPGVN